MRVTHPMTLAQVTQDLQRAMQKLAENQQKVASGRRWERASEDPIAARHAASYRSQIDRLEQYQRNVGRARGKLSYVESTLNEVGNVYTRLKSLLVEAASDTLTADDRKMLAEEVSALKSHVLQLANTQLEGQYLFGGSQVDTPPYVIENGTAIDYRGDDQSLLIQIGDQDTVAFNLSGREIFGDASSGLFHTLNLVEEALRNDDVAGIRWGLGKLDEHHESLLSARAQIGARMSYLDVVEENLSAAQLEATRALSDVEDVDLAETITELALNENQYRAAASAAARLLRRTILDYLA